MKNTCVLLEAKGNRGISLYTSPVNLNNPKSIHEAVLLFVDDLYSKEGCSDFNPEYYYQIDFDKLLSEGEVILNNNLHVKIMYGLGESV